VTIISSYSTQQMCQLLSDFNYMVSSLTTSVGHIPVVMETRRALYKLCGLYCSHDDKTTSHDIASHDPIINNVIKTLPPLGGVSTDEWAASMTAKKKS